MRPEQHKICGFRKGGFGMADAAKSARLKGEGETRNVGVNRIVALALFTGTRIAVGAFGDQ
jgi:hypothetical protein